MVSFEMELDGRMFVAFKSNVFSTGVFPGTNLIYVPWYKLMVSVSNAFRGGNSKGLFLRK